MDLVCIEVEEFKIYMAYIFYNRQYKILIGLQFFILNSKFLSFIFFMSNKIIKLNLFEMAIQERKLFFLIAESEDQIESIKIDL